MRQLLCYVEFAQFLKMTQPFDHLDLRTYGQPLSLFYTKKSFLQVQNY